MVFPPAVVVVVVIEAAGLAIVVGIDENNERRRDVVDMVLTTRDVVAVGRHCVVVGEILATNADANSKPPPT